MANEAKKASVNAEDKMRANLYALLGSLLFQRPTAKTLQSLSVLTGDTTEMGKAFNTLAKLAKSSDLQKVQEEYDGLFIGMGRGELLPYGSYYLTGFLNEKPLAKLRNSMTDLSIERQEDISEPEDHIGSLFEMMSGLILGNYGSPAPITTQREFYASHIESWATHFFKDLESAKLSKLYQPVGTIGRLFVEIESNAFSME